MSETWEEQRTPPHNIEAEQAVIGAIFLEPDAMSSTAEFCSRLIFIVLPISVFIM